MALLSNAADVPEQITSDKILTSSIFIPGSPGLPGPQGEPFSLQDNKKFSVSVGILVLSALGGAI